MIIILGNSYFALKIKCALQDVSDERVIYLNTSESILDKVMYILLIPFARVVYTVSGSVVLGGALWLALVFKTKIYQHFIGSDVTKAISDYAANNESKSLIKASRYLVEVSWIKDEVEQNLPIKTDIVKLPVLNDKYVAVKAESKKKNFKKKVLCYVGEGKEEFYGINTIIDVSSKMLHMDFVIIGSSCSSYKDRFKNNVVFLGWVELVEDLMSRCDVYLRVTAHDGLPFTVIEALSNSMYVIYNRPFPSCSLAETSDEIVKELTMLDREIEIVGKNDKGKVFVDKNFTYNACALEIKRILNA